MAQVGKISPKTQQTFLDSITVRDVFADYAYTWRRFRYRRRVAINGDQQLPGEILATTGWPKDARRNENPACKVADDEVYFRTFRPFNGAGGDKFADSGEFERITAEPGQRILRISARVDGLSSTIRIRYVAGADGRFFMMTLVILSNWKSAISRPKTLVRSRFIVQYDQRDDSFRFNLPVHSSTFRCQKSIVTVVPAPVADSIWN
jgi:hypothetical protein